MSGEELAEALRKLVPQQHLDFAKKILADHGVPQTLVGNFQGTAKAFGDSLASQPYLIAAALIAVYIVLTIVGTAFRGQGMELLPPWLVKPAVS